MTYDYELTLIGATTYITNDIGDSVPVEATTVVLCDVQSVTRSEHYSAAASGLKPEIVFVVNKFEYDGQKEVEFEGKKYKVDRSYSPKKSKGIEDFENLELICSGLVNGVM
ncbi:phage head closure protein [Desulfosporosinus sp. OT]|uniref:phage head closure protein n=1 Tax=Desulfosporosinus sp. OT TaxID=913865 RepID=UPI000223A379|nr:phage head closure protein [Desulfosporosinus sp. OT]EGW36466.1 prophage pi2 protein [Desulfosporosinus sp. OT]